MNYIETLAQLVALDQAYAAAQPAAARLDAANIAAHAKSLRAAGRKVTAARKAVELAADPTLLALHAAERA